MTTKELRLDALHWLTVADPVGKVSGVQSLFQQWQQQTLVLDTTSTIVSDKPIPGRPDRPLLVPPLSLPRRSMTNKEGRAVLLHALAHIEFNAINLGLDALWRFPGMPPNYYSDWMQVAAEEANHFALLTSHLETQGFSYGDFAAHDSLWELAQSTSTDVLARMALVPRTMEARGLDASPQLRAKLAQAGDHAAAEILDIILRDEIGHVAVGNRWFGWLCDRRGLEPISTYAALAAHFRAPNPRGPFNLVARRAAGFTEKELALLGK
jgi:uncharacterized ferritin-like protein (DUF455 family)